MDVSSAGDRSHAALTGTGDGIGALVRSSPTGAVVVDADDLRVMDANDSARRDLGRDTEIVGVCLSELLVGFPVEHAHALLRRLRQGLVDHLILETRRRLPDGSTSPVEIRFSYSPEPKPRYLALLLDLSERLTPDDLAIQRERLRDAMAEILRATTRINDRDELCRDACRIAVERAGFRMAWIGLVSPDSEEIVPVASAGHIEGYLDMLHLSMRDDPRGPGMTATAIETLQPVAIADPRTDPMFKTLHLEAQTRGYESALALPLVVEGHAIGALTVYATVVNAFGAIEVELLQHLADDISFKLEVIGREETRRAAESERDLLAAVVEQASESVVMTDREGRIVYVNPAFTRITGYERQEVLGRRSEFLRGDSQPAETAISIRDALLQGKPWAGQSRDRRKDGTERDMDLSISPRRDDSGAPAGTIVIGRDVSRERSLEAQLMQSQKLEAIGRLAGGVAHDFNNLLTAISGYAELLKVELGADDPRSEDVSEIQRAASRATALTAQLLAFSRRQILRPRPLDPESIVTGVAPMLRRLIGEDVDVVVSTKPGLGPIVADPSQLDQVLVNLALNARDAMPTGGRLDIEVDEAMLDAEFALSHLGAKPGPHVVFRVSDTGGGMTREVISRAFEPFFTTKGLGKGTGLGLSTVLGIVEQSSGYVDVESQPGVGTTVRVYLPKETLPSVDAPSGTIRPADRRGSGTVLVAEDEVAVRAFLCRILRGGGYTVLEAATAEQALEVEASYGGKIDLLFTDVILPGLSGRKLAEELLRRRPEIAVLYASGYNEETMATHGVVESGISYLGKPYSSEDVLRRLDEILAPDSGPSAG